MKSIRWDSEKAALLRSDKTRGLVGFEDAVVALEAGHVLDVVLNPVRSNQRMFILKINDYAYIVPFVEDNETIFLKTMYPSRKYTAMYIRRQK